MRKFKGAGFIVFLIVNLVFTIGAEIVNQKVDQIIDISTQLVKKQIKITAKDDKNAVIKEYHLYLPAFEYDKVSFIVASVSSESEVPTIKDDKQKKYILQFKNAQPSQTFKIYLVLANSLQPHPEEIKQNDKQLVQYESYLYYYSAYKTVTQSTTMKLSTSTIISHTGLKPLSVLGNKIKYGPYDNIQAFDEQMVTVHTENQTPFMTVTNLEREIEVSHWGNIAVNEDINLYHSGAKLKGSFSRYEYQKDGRSGQSSVKYYKTILPSTATGVYYRDSNGNISTSNLKQLSDSVELELRPRFPLFGGWKTQYILGYNVPSFEYLYNKGDQYVLKMRIVDHIFDDMFIEKATLKVILPEGASNIKLTTPYPVKRNENSMHFTYLDTVGRPVISFSKENLVENHIADFEISYKFSKTSLFQEPLLLIGFIYFIFILTIIFLRLDFSLSTTSHHSHKD